MKKFLKFYYLVKPLIPRCCQIMLRRQAVWRKLQTVTHYWPIDEGVPPAPAHFTGWPSQKKFAFLIMHDVESASGLARCEELLEIDKKMGFLSSFNLVPERYPISSSIRDTLLRSGYEIGIHGLKHDGKLYRSFKMFSDRAVKINRYLKEWEAVGFRSPYMHHNLLWIHQLNIEYDSSTFDTDPFEPQSDGTKSIFPFWVANDITRRGYVELPYTLTQDFTLFVLMKEPHIDTWIKKLNWLVDRNGMALVGVHPDYLNFGRGKRRCDEYPIRLYLDLLTYIRETYRDQFWNPLPKTLARFWRDTVIRRMNSVK